MRGGDDQVTGEMKHGWQNSGETAFALQRKWKGHK